MSQPPKLKLDEIGYWSEIKLDIIRDYAKAYSTILAAQEKPRFITYTSTPLLGPASTFHGSGQLL